MGQSGTANTIINLMLGWIRQLASSVANLFQSPSGMQSGGSALIAWIGANWLKLIIVLIIMGVLIDWIVWMLRWRPYWLWFRKRRVLLDDDIDQVLSDAELKHRYTDEDEADYAPRFRSEALSRDDDSFDEFDGELPDYDFDDDEHADDLDDDAFDRWDVDPYDAYGDPDDGYDEPDGADDGVDGGYDEPAEGDYDDGYDEPQDDYGDADDGYGDGVYDDSDPEWDDVPRKPGKHRFRLFGRKLDRRAADEDPFDVDEAELGDLDDDFYSEVSKKPRYGTDDMRQYARPAPDERDREEDGEADAVEAFDDHDIIGEFSGEADERTGYRPDEDPDGAPPRRRARRHRRN